MRWKQPDLIAQYVLKATPVACVWSALPLLCIGGLTVAVHTFGGGIEWRVRDLERWNAAPVEPD